MQSIISQSALKTNKTTYAGFEHHEVIHEKPDGETSSKHYLIFSKSLNEEIMKSLLKITDNEEFYSEKAKVTVDDLYQYYDQIKSEVEAGELDLIELAVFMGEVCKTKIEQYAKMSEDGKITFDNLANVFKIGTKFVTVINDKYLVGGVVQDTYIEQGSMGEKYFAIRGMHTFSDGSSYFQAVQKYEIPQFRGLVNLNTLNVRVMKDEDEIILNLRGEKFRQYSLGKQYLGYKGNMFRKTCYGNYYFKADGRIMVDVNGFNQMNPNYSRIHREGNTFNELTDEMLYLTYPYIYGFSFSSKMWGEIEIDNIEPIQFDDKAYDYLVLDEEIKKMSKALVTNVEYGFKDIISGKSGGCIFLLHGPPGTGKTLTCEAMAELLHKPLYSVTVGELGTTPSELEKNLSRILEIANSWNSVILLDEADIFMEKRTANDVNRNAMVSIFLRLLERHQGVLFLTTNRVESIDEAFRSRISIIIPYENLTEESRKKIWTNLFSITNINIPEDGIKFLSEFNINGRQIKNAIRMAQCISKDNNEDVNIHTITKAIRYLV